MTTLECDVAIIGAGTAGLAAERSARAAGAKTILIDDRFAGTTCTTVGCMPSKLLIAAADAAHAVRVASVFGIETQDPIIDGKAVLARVRSERDRFVASTLDSIEEIPDGIRQTAWARFVNAETLALDDGRRVKAKAVVIATGSAPHVPSMFSALGDLVLTNETIFELENLPRSVAVIGAGPLGLELAQALARLGVETTVFDEGDTLAGLKDQHVAAELRSILERELPIHLGVTLKVAREGGAARLSWLGTSEGSGTFAYVLVATGRPPRLEGVDLGATGIELDDHGTPKFDGSTLQCGTSSIFIAGDADHDRPVLHEASSQGAVAGRNAASFPKVEKFPRDPAFSITFTDPPLAVIGEPSADDSVVGSASYGDQGRAKIDARNAGLVRVYAAHPDGRLTGAVMAAPGMDHIGHLLVWAIKRGETATGLLSMPFYHPTLEEGLKTALRSICKAVQSPLPRDRDEGNSPGS